MAEHAKHIYDESKIKTLSSLEHIRLRTGMYIGRIGNGSHPDDGCYILLKEVVDNAVDEFIMGHGREVQIHIAGPRVSVRDFGRGIPLGKVVDCVSKLNTGAKCIPHRSYPTPRGHPARIPSAWPARGAHARSRSFRLPQPRDA